MASKSDWIEGPKNPFFYKTYVVGSHRFHCYYMQAAERIGQVKHFDADECRTALSMREHLQKTVVRAIEKRLRQLEGSA